MHSTSPFRFPTISPSVSSLPFPLFPLQTLDSLQERISVAQAELLDDVGLGDVHFGEVSGHIHDAGPPGPLDATVGEPAWLSIPVQTAQVGELGGRQVVLAETAHPLRAIAAAGGDGCGAGHVEGGSVEERVKRVAVRQLKYLVEGDMHYKTFDRSVKLIPV